MRRDTADTTSAPDEVDIHPVEEKNPHGDLRPQRLRQGMAMP
jgi:hypothetical protein